jgi:hypothetical protein
LCFLALVFVAFLTQYLESFDVRCRHFSPGQRGAWRENEVELEQPFQEPPGMRPLAYVIQQIERAAGAAHNRDFVTVAGGTAAGPFRISWTPSRRTLIANGVDRSRADAFAQTHSALSNRIGRS